MLAAIEKNKELVAKYSKYELVRIVFGLLKIRKEKMDKAHKQIEITEVVDEIITDIANGDVSIEEIDALLVDSDKV
ncbi:MAG: hypothetical protein GY817_05325 [bacterium]|nr:hypothetical protein [bacterium]